MCWFFCKCKNKYTKKDFKNYKNYTNEELLDSIIFIVDGIPGGQVTSYTLFGSPLNEFIEPYVKELNQRIYAKGKKAPYLYLEGIYEKCCTSYITYIRYAREILNIHDIYRDRDNKIIRKNNALKVYKHYSK